MFQVIEVSEKGRRYHPNLIVRHRPKEVRITCQLLLLINYRLKNRIYLVLIINLSHTQDKVKANDMLPIFLIIVNWV